MKTALKITGTILLVMVFVFIIAAATIPRWFPVDKVKNIIIGQVEEKTGRKVLIKSLEFNLFKGFELKGFSMKENARYGAKKDFIRDDSIVLKYNLFALFAGELVIEKFELVDPYVQIIKEENGDYNFSDILKKLAEDKEKAAGAKGKAGTRPKEEKTPAPARPKKTPPIKNIIITSIGVKNGNFEYADHSKPKSMSLKIRNFNFDMENLALSLVKPIGINLKCVVIYNDYKIPVSMKTAAGVNLSKKSATIDIASFSIGGMDTNGKISITGFKDAKGSLTTVSNVRKMLEVLPPDLSAKLKDTNASIDIMNILNFTYKDGKVTFNDVLKMENGEFTYKNNKVVEKFGGRFDVNNKAGLAGNINFLLAGNEVKIKAEGSNIDSPADSIYRVNIYSPKFAIEYLLAMFPQKEKKAGQPVTKKTAPVKTEKKKISGAPGIYLELKADSIFYRDVTIGKTIASIRFVNAKLYSEFSMMCYDGSINGSAVMDINTENYTLAAGIKSVKLHDLIDDAISVIPKKDAKKKNVLDDLKDKVYGNLNMDSKFRGSTFKEPALTVNGEGGFKISDGKIASTETGRDIASKFGITFLSKEIPFDIMAGNFIMSKGRINIKDFKVHKGPNGEGGSVKIRANGWTTVDRALDFKVETDISPSEAKQVEEYFARNLNIRDVSYAYNKDGW
ncbi:MAG: AsmA family protein, partial [Oligoflexia bacterium]|nr:AsmA family protein [Oligoflexia bacterium]